ncbi:hypothetical protein [Sporosarcina limicola]|uniref:Uncharacterized protein n=1 Tax=Sporosarcina limicola TaxID=34101 RepID=A0A927MMN8_9BACL|nr:hypothetical protein [Sporosarcina limicola]MBE1557140.1 hypothetical protein [Sporosarcina limicola]
MFEIEQRDKRQNFIFIGRLKRGELEQLSESFSTVQEAKIKLDEVQRYKESAPQQLVEMERDE